jgi:hypothetical protein
LSRASDSDRWTRDDWNDWDDWDDWDAS